ncbi:MAG: tRNA pseudouridine(38-40) synthase TruA [Chloroflexota bacterium]|nr:tRNA pseudouridine(38-40) synthase TruA [Chloroflexota bacterium]
MTSENAAHGTARRIALVVAYDGTDYAGFQSQVGVPTIQSELETAISRLTGTPSRVRGASRTDAGAHACGQVVDFTTESALDSSVFVPAMNYYLPEAIRVTSALDVPPEFHSRYDAAHREYRYSILNRDVASPLLRRTHHLETAPLELSDIRKAATSLLGIRDFRRVSASYPADRSTVRKVLRWEAKRHPSIPDVITIDCAANGFLRHQIRRANAVLIEIGKGKLPIHAMAETLAGRTPIQHRIRTLPAKGLCLKSVHYPGYDHLFAPKVEDKHETH